MLAGIDYIYFSPTGNTRKCGLIVSKSLSDTVHEYDLGSKKEDIVLKHEVVVIALPVFGGRIPAFTADKLLKLDGKGKKVITLVVYGNRAYEDALIEMNDCVKKAGFHILASSACLAQHSIANEVAKGRPDDNDKIELEAFANQILDKLLINNCSEPVVPGNHPYKGRATNSNSIISLDSCVLCGKCEEVCPVNAIRIEDKVETEGEKCIMCLSCVIACPMNARVIPDALKVGMEARLSPLKDVYHKNEFYL